MLLITFVLESLSSASWSVLNNIGTFRKHNPAISEQRYAAEVQNKYCAIYQVANKGLAGNVMKKKKP